MLKVDPDEYEMWKEYTAGIDKIVEEGFQKIIKASLNYFLRETDASRQNLDPLFEAQLQLKPPEILFSPSLNLADTGGFYEQIEELIHNVYEQCTLISHISEHLDQENFLVRI